MFFEFGNTRIYISFAFLVILCLLLVAGSDYSVGYAFLSILLHELGHVLVLKHFCGHIKSVKFTPFGLKIDIPAGGISYKKEIQAALAGPLVNMFLCICFFAMGKYYAAYINIALFVFNMLPVSDLDGGRILGALISQYISPDTACIVLKVSGSICIIFVFSLLFAGSLLGRMNLTLFLSAAYLTFLTFSGSRSFIRKRD